MPTFMVPIGQNLKTLVLLQVRLFTQSEKYVNNVWWWIALNLGPDVYCFSDKCSKWNWPKGWGGGDYFLMWLSFLLDNIVCPWCKKTKKKHEKTDGSCSYIKHFTKDTIRWIKYTLLLKKTNKVKQIGESIATVYVYTYNLSIFTFTCHKLHS